MPLLLFFGRRALALPAQNFSGIVRLKVDISLDGFMPAAQKIFQSLWHA
jgi:hypothetical protein